jgi:hypothetical protein
MATTLPKLRGSGSASSTQSRLLTLFLGLAIACSAHTIPPQSRPIEGVSLPGDSTSPSSTWCVAEPLRSTEAKHGVVGPLADLNTQFLQAHARARAQQCADLEANRLVLRYSFGLFEARFRGQEVTRMYILPREYHPVKDVSHAVYLSALLFAQPPGVERDRHVVQALSALNSALAELRNPTSPTATLLPLSFHEREVRLLQRTLDAVASFSVAGLGSDGQRAYFESVRGDLKDNLRDIATASLQGLHGAVESTRTKVAKVDPKAWDSALVVVGVMHQARAREIGIQYFERLLDEHVGEGARNERRLVVAEHMTVPSEQLGLLSAHLVDEGGAAAVFADPLRLQWDALGDVDPATLDTLFHQ